MKTRHKVKENHFKTLFLCSIQSYDCSNPFGIGFHSEFFCFVPNLGIDMQSFEKNVRVLGINFSIYF